MKIRQKGFGLPLLIIIIAIIALVSGLYLYRTFGSHGSAGTAAVVSALTPPSAPALAIPADFGGMYVDASSYDPDLTKIQPDLIPSSAANPLTADASCPVGYSSETAFAGPDGLLIKYCAGQSSGPDSTLLDFGGIFVASPSTAKNISITKTVCPIGYTPQALLTLRNVSASGPDIDSAGAGPTIYDCYRPHVTGTYAPTFAGMYGSLALSQYNVATKKTTQDGIPTNINNAATGSQSCPAGFSVSDTSSSDTLPVLEYDADTGTTDFIGETIASIDISSCAKPYSESSFVLDELFNDLILLKTRFLDFIPTLPMSQPAKSASGLVSLAGLWHVPAACAGTAISWSNVCTTLQNYLNALPANPTVNDLKTELQDLANQTQNYCQKLGPADPNQASCNALAASLNHLLSVLNSTVDPFGLVPALPGGLSLDKQTVIDNAAAYCSAWANRLDCNGNGNIDPSELAALDALMGHNGGGVATLLSTAQKTVDQLYASGQICPDKDKCPNIPGIQKKVPDGYVIDASGMCVSIKGPWTNEFDETITAQCPPGEVGSTNTVTIKAGTVTSTISQEDANNQAAALSRTQAIAGLQCTVANSWTNDAESIEAFCPAGTVGDPQTGYVNQGEVTSTISQKDADAKALALALSRAEAQLQCVVDVCPNIAGAQAAVPAGMTIDSAGDCVPACDCDQGQAAAVSVAVSVCTCGVSSKQLPASSLPESSATESNL